MRRKRRFFACVLLCLVMSLSVQVTQAYFAASRTAHNVITSGGIDIVLHEETDGGKPFQNLTGVMPGQTTTKKVYVENADEDAWVRILCDVYILDSAGKKMNLTEAQLANLIRINYNDQAWTKKDGFWYYGKALSQGDETEPLFTEVKFDGPAMDNTYQNCSVMIEVQAQATQKANNGKTVFEAAGWPNPN